MKRLRFSYRRLVATRYPQVEAGQFLRLEPHPNALPASVSYADGTIEAVAVPDEVAARLGLLPA